MKRNQYLYLFSIILAAMFSLFGCTALNSQVIAESSKQSMTYAPVIDNDFHLSGTTLSDKQSASFTYTTHKSGNRFLVYINYITLESRSYLLFTSHRYDGTIYPTVTVFPGKGVAYELMVKDQVTDKLGFLILFVKEDGKTISKADLFCGDIQVRLKDVILSHHMGK